MIDGIGKSVDGHFGNGVQAEDEIRRETAVEIRERIVGFEAVHDIAVGERGKSVELHVAVSICAADEIVSASRCIDQGAWRELQRVGQVAAWIREIFQSRSVEIRGGVRVFGIDKRRRAGYFDRLVGLRYFQGEVDRLLLVQAREDIFDFVAERNLRHRL